MFYTSKYFKEFYVMYKINETLLFYSLCEHFCLEYKLGVEYILLMTIKTINKNFNVKKNDIQRHNKVFK